MRPKPRITFEDILYPEGIQEKLGQLVKYFLELPSGEKERVSSLFGKTYSKQGEMDEALDRELKGKTVEIIDEIHNGLAYLTDTQGASTDTLASILTKNGLDEATASRLVATSGLVYTPVRDGRKLNSLSDKTFKQLLSEYIRSARLAPQFPGSDRFVSYVSTSYNVEPDVVHSQMRMCNTLINGYLRYAIGPKLLREALSAVKLSDDKAEVFLELVEKNQHELRQEYTLNLLYDVRSMLGGLASAVQSSDEDE